MPLSFAGQNAKAKEKKEIERKAQANPMLNPPIMSQPNPMLDPPMPSQQQSGSRVQLMQYLNPEPQRDVNEEARLKKLAKVNAFGKMIGSVGQLAGMASGGDATMIQDNMSPFVMNKMQTMDTDYRDQLKDYTNRAFQVDMYNNKLSNDDLQTQDAQDFQKNIRTDDQNFRISERELDQDFRSGETNKTITAQQKNTEDKFKYDMKLFNARSKEDKDQLMMRVGVDPKDPEAMSKFQKAVQGNTNKGITEDPEFLATVRRGRDMQLQILKKQYQELEKEPSNYADAKAKENKLKAISDRINMYEKVDLTKDKQVALDLYDFGAETDLSVGPPEGYDRPSNMNSGQQAQPGQQPVQQKQRTTESNQEMMTQLSNIIKTRDFSNIDPLLKMMVEYGYADNEDAATEMILDEMEKQAQILQ